MIGCLHRGSGPAVEDLPYLPNASARQQADLYLPDGPGPHPVAVVIHGGGWTGRDRSDMADISQRLADADIAALNINYRLAPDHHFPAQLEDVQAAMAWVADHADLHEFDLNRLYTVGYSAGAHLALLAASSTTPGLPDVRAVVAGGAPTDLTRYPDSPYVQDLMGISFEKNPDAFRQASPLHQVDATHPPVFLYHGRLDRIVAYRNATLLQEALEQEGVPVELHTRLLECHVLTYLREAPSLRRAVRFLESL
jgi:acetyl esterase/lipase